MQNSEADMHTKVTTTHLYMDAPSKFEPKFANNRELSLMKVGIPNPSLNHYFFANIGIPFKWYSRLKWTYNDWKNYVEKNYVHTWVGYDNGSPYGYFELQARENETEIKYFGILSQFFGKGYGGHLLSCAIREAWNLANTKRVYVHTCTLDHESALPNYQARGFVIDRSVTDIEDVPNDSDAIWNSHVYFESIQGNA